MKLTQLSLPELQKLQNRISSEIAKRKANAKQNLLKKIQRMASSEGLSMEDILKVTSKSVATGKPEVRSPKKKLRADAGKTVAAKYRHPINSSMTWTGRGRQPRWVGDYLANGGSLDALRI